MSQGPQQQPQQPPKPPVQAAPAPRPPEPVKAVAAAPPKADEPIYRIVFNGVGNHTRDKVVPKSDFVDGTDFERLLALGAIVKVS